MAPLHCVHAPPASIARETTRGSPVAGDPPITRCLLWATRAGTASGPGLRSSPDVEADWGERIDIVAMTTPVETVTTSCRTNPRLHDHD